MARAKRQWFVAQCRSSQEEVASEALLAQRFEVYLPRVWEERRAAEVAVPLFPCYLFVRFNPARVSSAPIRSTRGVVGLVRFGDLPAVVPDDLIAALKQGEGSDGVFRMSGPPPLRAGERVVVASGPFAGCLATVAEAERGARVLVLLDALLRLNRVSLPREMLDRVPAEVK